jgi:U6 snRNA-associated Sm-like protein LSm2
LFDYNIAFFCFLNLNSKKKSKITSEGKTKVILINLFITKMLFYSFFKTLVGKRVTVELKNDVAVSGILHSVDQYLNVKLEQVKVVDPERFPQLAALHTLFIRGSVVRFVMMDPSDVDTELLQDAARRESQAVTTTNASR